MNHNEVSAICRRLVAETLNIKESEISVEPWDEIIYDFAKEASQHNYPEHVIDEKFRERIAEKLLTQRELHEFWANSMQRHHDYYVFLHREEHGNLNNGDMAQYNLAMQREHDGLCRPLRKDAISPFG